MLLQVKGIDVNKEVLISIIVSFLPCPLITLLSLTSVILGVVCLSSFYLQGRLYGPPLQVASKNGHTEIVAMLLQVKGIDVNKEVHKCYPS